MTDILHLDPVQAAFEIENGVCPAYLVPIVLAVLDHGCGFGTVVARAPWHMPTDRPVIVTVGDNMNVTVGPNAFHFPSVRRFARTCHTAFIIATAPVPKLYAAAAAEAAIGRHNVIVVETRLRHEADWVEVLQKANPRIAITLSTCPTEGTA
jgi:hypothetical protein